MGEVIQFPDKSPLIERRYKITLYTEYEIECVLAALNTFPKCLEKITEETLPKLDPIFIRQSLDFATTSSIISHEAKLVMRDIIDNNFEEITFEDI